MSRALSLFRRPRARGPSVAAEFPRASPIGRSWTPIEPQHEVRTVRGSASCSRPCGSATRFPGLHEWRIQRAIGVVYVPEDEEENWVPTRLSDRSDAFISIDRTRSLRPLRDEPSWQRPL